MTNSVKSIWIEYPAAGIQEIPLKQARDVLKDMPAEILMQEESGKRR